VLAFASKGGGGDKKNAAPFKNDFTPINAASGFTLKNGYSYSGSYIFNQAKTADKTVSFNAMVSYQKGNSIYIMPYKYKVNISSMGAQANSNLQLVGVRIRMSK
jgi:hypothetical protein